MSKVEVGKYFGACLVCRKYIHEEQALVIGFDALCWPCAEGVARVVGQHSVEDVSEEVVEDVSSETVRVCKTCGEEFDNVGKFLAHTRAKRCGN